MSDIYKKINNLSPEKKKLLMEKLMKKKSGEQAKTGIPPKDPGTPFYSSIAQEGLFFDNQLNPWKPWYNGTGYLKLTGKPDAEKLEKAINQVVKRHEALRTLFKMGDNCVLLNIINEIYVPLQKYDLSTHPEEERESLFFKKLEEENLTTFDLLSGPLIRTVLVAMTDSDKTVADEQSYYLIITMHHIISDEWSLDIFIENMIDYYEEQVTGVIKEFPRLAIQFSDFAGWQRKEFNETKKEKNEQYWSNKLNGRIDGIKLPLNSGVDSEKEYLGNLLPVEISAELLAGLKDLAHRENVTLFVVILAVYKILLHYYSGQNDLILNFPVSDRSHKETEQIIGYFLSMPFLRTDISDDPSFLTLLQRIRRELFETHSHREIAMQKLFAYLRKNDNFHPDVVNNIAFNYIDGKSRKVCTVGGVRFDEVEIFFTSAIYNLSLMLVENENGIRGFFRYKKALYRDDFIKDMRQNFYRMLSVITGEENKESKGLAVSKFCTLLSGGDEGKTTESQLLEKLHDTTMELAEPQPLHRLFEQQVEKNGDVGALDFEEQSLTYRELNEKANRLASYLIKKGLQPGRPVVVAVERSADMVIAMLAVIKAGGFYIPVDPTFPVERINYFIEDGAPDYILCHTRFEHDIPSPGTGEKIVLDALDLSSENPDNPERETDVDALAYVLYTSGSTGYPKGVMISHRNLFNYFSWLQSTVPLSTDDAIIQKSPAGFDASVREIFWPLISGARLVVAIPAGHLDADYLMGLINNKGVTIGNFVPSMLKIFVDEGGMDTLNKLRLIISGGEALPVNLAETILNQTSVELFNFYGPTETTITATYHHCQRSAGYHTVPIGKPIANAKAYILDEYKNPTRAGVPGELYLGGAGLGQGYLNKEKLTEQYYIAAPPCITDVDRLYRTGDIVRCLPDGNLEFISRVDHQVKIRGNRIELGEIEAVLSRYEKIHQAVVVTRKNTNNDMVLAAYLCSADTPTPIEIDEVREYLKNQLPDFMIPTHFMVLDQFPLNDNGKIDRKKLPAINTEQKEQRSSLNEPLTEIENSIADVWKSVLKIDTVGLNDNFFDLGGYSLLLYRIRRKIERTLGVTLSVLELFEHPTVAQIAQCILQKQDGAGITKKDTAVQEEISGRVNRRKSRLRRRRTNRE